MLRRICWGLLPVALVATLASPLSLHAQSNVRKLVSELYQKSGMQEDIEVIIPALLASSAAGIERELGNKPMAASTMIKGLNTIAKKYPYERVLSETFGSTLSADEVRAIFNLMDDPAIRDARRKMRELFRDEKSPDAIKRKMDAMDRLDNGAVKAAMKRFSESKLGKSINRKSKSIENALKSAAIDALLTMMNDMFDAYSELP